MNDALRVGSTLELKITSLASDGSGVAEFAGRRVHVPGAGAGDVVAVRIDALSRHSDSAFATLQRVESAGGTIRRAPCHHAAPMRGACGGCAIMHVEYDAQRDAKRQWVTEALGGLLGDGAVTVVPAPSELGYRNRGNYWVQRAPDGLTVRLGSRAPRTGAFARMDGCLAQRPSVTEMAERVAREATARAVPVYPDDGGLRYVSVRAGDDDACVVELVTGAGGTRWVDGLATALLERGARGVYHAINATEGNVVHGGGPPRLLAGRGEVETSLGGVAVRLGPTSFSQLNTSVASQMAARVASMAAEVWRGDAADPAAGARAVWDLYCGVGVLGVAAARATGASLVVGHEVAAEAVEAARRVASTAGVAARFETVNLQDRAAVPAEALGVIIVNPPRRGLSAAVLSAVLSVDVPIVMMSCDATSFARDAQALVAAGRTMGRVEVYDMLPQTTHVELLATFR